MRSNIGFTDKVIRVAVAAVISVVIFSQTITGALALCLFFIAYLLVITAFRGNCPVYRLLGINTHKNLNDKARLYEFHQRNQALLKNYLKNYRESTRI